MGVTHNSGFSGASGLHDSHVILEAVSPGEINCNGEGLDIFYGFGCTPFGECLAATSVRGIAYLFFVEDGQRQQAVNSLRNYWLQASLFPDSLAVSGVIQDIFKYDSSKRPLVHAFVKGTEFQLSVWRMLLQVPDGQLVSYGQLADSIDKPNASRAVGSAVGKNPLAYLIPCHRVIRGTGVIGGYRWGQERKRLMIAHESRQPIRYNK